MSPKECLPSEQNRRADHRRAAVVRAERRGLSRRVVEAHRGSTTGLWETTSAPSEARTEPLVAMGRAKPPARERHRADAEKRDAAARMSGRGDTCATESAKANAKTRLV